VSDEVCVSSFSLKKWNEICGIAEARRAGWPQTLAFDSDVVRHVTWQRDSVIIW